MSRNLNIFSKCILGCGLAPAVSVPLGSAHAKGFSVLYSFKYGDGAHPTAGLIADGAGNLYGTTFEGGYFSGNCENTGCGTVFKLAPGGTETELYSFTGGSDGSAPYAGLIMDKKDNLYSTTYYGGTGTGCGGDGCGTVFKLAPNGTETVLYSFTGGIDGAYPHAGLIMDSSGNLYSTTERGGAGGYGVVFKLAPDGTETVLHSFIGGSDGTIPFAGLIMDKKGNLYSTTVLGGAYDDGVVFKLAPNGTETVLYSFCPDGDPCTDGKDPAAGLIMDKKGNLYSTTFIGGPDSRGVVFELALDGTETVLHSFTQRSGGEDPEAGLIVDKKGNLYSTTSYGGADKDGVVFKLKE